MPCSFGLLPHPRSAACGLPSRLLEVTVTIRCIPLETAAYGTWVARPPRTTALPQLAAMAPVRPEGEAVLGAAPRGQEPRGLATAGWGDSNSGPPPDGWPGHGSPGGLTCGFLLLVVTAHARCIPLPDLPTSRVPTVDCRRSGPEATNHPAVVVSVTFSERSPWKLCAGSES
jgi:hypothetical protein